MGYYTIYSLDVLVNLEDILEEDYDENKADIIMHLRDTCEGAEYALDDNGKSGEKIKWYDHEEDIGNFSKLYPNQVFKLEGEGEESGDIWIKYFSNGKMQECPAIISFDNYDKGKLTDILNYKGEKICLK